MESYSATDQTILNKIAVKPSKQNWWLEKRKYWVILCSFLSFFLVISTVKFSFSRMSSNSEWLVCGLCGAKVNCDTSYWYSLNYLIQRSDSCLIIQITENFWRVFLCKTWRIFQQSMNLAYRLREKLAFLSDFFIVCRLCLVCTVKTQTVNEFQEFACKSLKIKAPWNIGIFIKCDMYILLRKNPQWHFIEWTSPSSKSKPGTDPKNK